MLLLNPGALPQEKVTPWLSQSCWGTVTVLSGFMQLVSLKSVSCATSHVETPSFFR